jgi:translation initiation factor 2B subunit (eIF-2B alpha/beta/delta family)
MARRKIVKDDSGLLQLIKHGTDQVSAVFHQTATTNLGSSAIPVATLLSSFDNNPSGVLPERTDDYSEVEGTDYSARTITAIREVPMWTHGEWTRLQSWLRVLIAAVTKHWRDTEGIPFIPVHGPEHSVRMVEILCRNFRNDLYRLSDPERRLLLASIWLHDIGMVVGGAEPGDVQRLETFPQRSAGYVLRHFYQLGLSKEEARVVSELCQLHSDYRYLNSLEMRDDGAGVAINRQKLVLAFLRLAELLEIRQERVKGRNLALLATLPQQHAVNIEVLNDFLRNLFVTRIYRDPARPFRLCLDVAYGLEAPDENIDKLIAILKNGLLAALGKVRDVLLLEKIPELVQVETFPCPESTPEFSNQRLEALYSLGTAGSPNAGQVIDAILGNLETMSDVSAIKRYVDIDLSQFISLRPGHAQIRNLRADLQAALEASTQDTLANVGATLLRYRETKGAAHRKIGQVARELFKGECTFIVFGYSAAVAAALKALPDDMKQQSHIIAMESRNKTVHGEDNTVQYIDGVASASAIRALGYQDVVFISDACLATILSELQPKRLYVLLGINAIHPEGQAYSSPGNFMVALIARHFGATIFALGESTKIRADAHKSKGGRRNNWLTNDHYMLDRLRKDNVSIYSPIDDEIPREYIDAYITEHGQVSPTDLHKVLDSA